MYFGGAYFSQTYLSGFVVSGAAPAPAPVVAVGYGLPLELSRSRRRSPERSRPTVTTERVKSVVRRRKIAVITELPEPEVFISVKAKAFVSLGGRAIANRFIHVTGAGQIHFKARGDAGTMETAKLIVVRHAHAAGRLRFIVQATPRMLPGYFDEARSLALTMFD